YRGAVDFKPGGGTYTLPYSGSNGGGFVTKLNSSGSLTWAKPVGIGMSAVNDLTLDASGDIYLTGSFQGQVDFDPGAGTTLLTSNGSTDVFVAKFTSSGNFAWSVSFGGTYIDMGMGIAVDAAGNVSVVGIYYNTVDFDPDPSATYLLTSGGA